MPHTPDHVNLEGLERRIGGKGAKLARMQSIGCNVPAWFAVEADQFRRAMEHADVQAAIARAGELVGREQFEEAELVVHAGEGILCRSGGQCACDAR